MKAALLVQVLVCKNEALGNVCLPRKGCSIVLPYLGCLLEFWFTCLQIIRLCRQKVL
jgi:hypothetical protein